MKFINEDGAIRVAISSNLINRLLESEDWKEFKEVKEEKPVEEAPKKKKKTKKVEGDK